MGLRLESYPGHARIVTGIRYMELPPDFPRSMPEVYAMSDRGPTIADPRTFTSYGGGACPEQHWGYLRDGRPFYFRMRSATASLCVGPIDVRPDDLPLINPKFNMAEHKAAFMAGLDYGETFFLGPRPEAVVYPDDPLVGWFQSDEDRQRVFTTLLDQLLEPSGTGTGWCAPSP